jgi:hypothetical protein
MAERNPEFPLHRLNSPRTKLWLISPTSKKRTAWALSRMYRGGVGVCSATLRLIAYVDPRGGVTELPPPHKRYEMWQIANRPNPVTECPCGNFFDPEVQGPYRDRGTDTHHPMCQFDRTAKGVFGEAMNRAATRMGLQYVNGVPIIGGEEPKRSVIKPLTPQARPDEWENIRKEYQGR